MTEEERRALLFRDECAARARARAARCARLASDPAAAARLREAFAALLPGPSDGWDCPKPPEPARPGWVSSVPGGVEVPEYLKR